jgi:hypothetical protein
MSKPSVGKLGAMKHNSGNISDNKKKSTDAGHKRKHDFKQG